MKYDFTYNDAKYVLDFDDLDAKDIKGVAIRIYYHNMPNYSFTIRRIVYNKILWEGLDLDVPQQVKDHFNKIIKNKAFL